MAKRLLAWRDMYHDHELLLEHDVGAWSTRTKGPIPEFLAKKRAEQEPKTADWHEEALTQLLAFFEECGLTTVGDFTEANVNRFRVHLRSRKLSEITIANRLRSIKAFARWMSKTGWTEGNRLADMRVPQSTKPHFELIPPDVFQQLFSLFPPDTFLGSRNLAILTVLAETGVRREEAANLLANNVDLDRQVIRVYSDKTEEWRCIPLTDEATAVRNYLKWRDLYFNKPARLGGARRIKQPRRIAADTRALCGNARIVHLVTSGSARAARHFRRSRFVSIRHLSATRLSAEGSLLLLPDATVAPAR